AGEDRREHEAYLHALGPVLRNQELMMEQAFDEQLERHWPVSGELREMSVEFAARDTARFSSEGIAGVGAVLVPILIVAWPSAWLLVAFLVRGGLSLRLMGIRLVSSDGRPAARWRCLWRAFVLWGPLTALLLVSARFESQYWFEWAESAHRPALLW